MTLWLFAANEDVQMTCDFVIRCKCKYCCIKWPTKHVSLISRNHSINKSMLSFQEQAHDKHKLTQRKKRQIN